APPTRSCPTAPRAARARSSSSSPRRAGTPAPPGSSTSPPAPATPASCASAWTEPSSSTRPPNWSAIPPAARRAALCATGPARCVNDTCAVCTRPFMQHGDAKQMREQQFGKYLLLDRIAVGGMAEIFLARQVGPEGFEKTVVLKRIRPHLGDEQSFVRMFLNEAKLAAQLNHPNIIQIHDLGNVSDTYFIAMEDLCGRDV